MKTEPRLLALGPLRHACHACGTCCQGWRVALVDQLERARIQRAARHLGIADPIVDGALRQRDDGRCVFLTDDRLCAIHATLGADHKPKVCQQFPRRATLAEDGYRVGLDPACTSTHRSWRVGPEVDPLPAMQEERRLPADVAASEQGLIRLARAPGATIPFFVGHFIGDPRHLPALPPPFSARACTLLGALDLASVASLQGPDVASRVAHLVPRLPTLDAAAPPPLTLAPEHDAFALEVVRRQLFLRLGDPAVPPFVQALLILLGVLAAAWSEPPTTATPPDPQRLPEALSAWARLVRAPRFWQRLLPDLARARWLVTGAST